MKVDYTLDSAGAMLHRRGLNPDGRVQRQFTVECARQMDPYVPMRQGTLKNTRFIGPDYVEYRMPYAHYQYVGKLMVGVESGSPWARSGEPKRYVAPPVSLQYHSAPKRGALWDKRMWADKGRQITAKMARMAGGKAT